MYQIALPFSDFCLHSGAWTEPFHSESLPSRFSADGLALAVSHFLGIHRHAGPSTCVTRAAVTITWGRGPRWKWNQRTNGKPGHGHRRNGSSAPFQRAAPCGGRVQFEYFKFRLISTVRSRSDGPCAGGAATDGAVWARRRALFLSDLTVAVAAFLSALAAASPPVPNSHPPLPIPSPPRVPSLTTPPAAAPERRRRTGALAAKARAARKPPPPLVVVAISASPSRAAASPTTPPAALVILFTTRSAWRYVTIAPWMLKPPFGSQSPRMPQVG
jgi:hypothetical protein